MTLRWGVLLLCSALASCATARTVRLDTGAGELLVHSPRSDARPVKVERGEFEQAVQVLSRDVSPFARPLRGARQLWGVPERMGTYLYEARNHRVVPLIEGTDAAQRLHLLDSSQQEGELSSAYSRWCARKARGGDCLHLLEEDPFLTGDGRYTLAMAIAMDSVWGETAEALKDMANPQAVLATVTSAVTMYMLLWVMPEPMSKGLAAILTATAIAYLGVDTVWRIFDGWVQLVRAVDRATSFEGVREAGERYGAVLGKNAARVFVMLATAAIGNTMGLAAKSSGLPGSAQAALEVETQAGLPYAAIGNVQAVTMTSEGFTVALASNVVAMSAGGGREDHHLATIANEKSTARGGPWTPRFRELFKKAGMELKDPENIVSVEGHRGPHPERYHRIIYGELETAMRGCRSVEQCRVALETVLKKLAQEVATPGSELNLLITQGIPR